MAQVIKLNESDFALMIEKLVIEALEDINKKKLNEVAPVVAATASGTAAGASGATAASTSGATASGTAAGASGAANSSSSLANLASGVGEPGEHNPSANAPQNNSIGGSILNSIKNTWNHAVKSFGIGDRLRQRGYNVDLTTNKTGGNVSVSRDEYNKFQNMKQSNPDLYNSASTRWNGNQ